MGVMVMKHFEMVLLAVMASVACLSGCVTRMDLPDGRIRGEAKQRLQQRRAATAAAAKRLRSDFELVFSDPEYLSLEDTPARAALSDHFWRLDEKNPSPEQFVRLVDILRQRPQLLHPLRTLWLSRHATFAQRMAAAKTVDGLKDGKILNGRSRKELLQFLLPREKTTAEEYRKIQQEVDRDGPVYAWASDQLEKLAQGHEQVERRMKTLNALREASYR